MAAMEVKNHGSPDETRSFVSNGKMDIVKLGDAAIGKAVFEPGWQWSKHVKPIAGTDSCQVFHLGYVMSGRMGVRMNDGTEGECGPGDVVRIEPGHDAWTVGNEACVMLDFGGAAHYAEHH